MSKWYQLDRDDSGNAYVSLWAKAMLREPFTWLGIIFAAIAIWKEMRP